MKKIVSLILTLSILFTYSHIEAFAVSDSDYVLQSNHFILDIPMDIIKRDITPQNLTRWLNHLDAAYDAYADLVGRTPSNGAKITIKDSTDTYGALWVYGEGNPYIYWQINCIDLKPMNNNDDWNFGVLHEIGHLFDIDGRWNWHAEFWANTKMLYVIDKIGARVNMNYAWRSTLSDMKNYYSADYNLNFKDGIYKTSNNDALTYVFIKIIEKIGWEPFKKTFRSYYDNSYKYELYSISGNTALKNNQFNDFIDRLTYFSGLDIRKNVFTEAELTVLEKAYKKDALAVITSVSASSNWQYNNGAAFNGSYVYNISKSKQSNFHFNLYSPKASSNAALRIYYATGKNADSDASGGRYATIYVSGRGYYDIYFPNTDWKWGYIDVPISINAGNNDVGVYWSGYSSYSPDFYKFDLIA